MKKRVVYLIATQEGRYRVEKNVNTLEPRVGSIIDRSEVAELMLDQTLEVHIKDMKR